MPMSVLLFSTDILEVRLAELATSVLHFRVFRVFRGQHRSPYLELRFATQPGDCAAAISEHHHDPLQLMDLQIDRDHVPCGIDLRLDRHARVLSACCHARGESGFGVLAQFPLHRGQDAPDEAVGRQTDRLEGVHAGELVRGFQ